jgi:hypothetical protein
MAPIDLDGRAMSRLHIDEADRNRLDSSSLAIDDSGNEVFVGLNRDESQRYADILRLGEKGTDIEESEYLRESHERALLFWRIALRIDRSSAIRMTPESAFDLGYTSWNPFAGDGQIEDFENMIRQVPKDLRLAALNGWLSAIDDEAAGLE